MGWERVGLVLVLVLEDPPWEVRREQAWEPEAKRLAAFRPEGGKGRWKT